MSVTSITGPQIRDGSIDNAKVASGAAIASSKLADGANFIKKDGSVAMTGPLDMGSQIISNVATPSAGTDGANKNYVLSVLNGLDWKNSVRVATTANGTLASAFENGDTVDGVTLVTGDRILIKNQSSPAENGIYTVNASGAPTRATDADGSGEITANLAVFVSEGTTNGDTQWTLTTNDPITIGSTSLTFVQAGAGTSYSADETSIHLSGATFSAIFGSGSGTVCQGNDSRLSDARTPVGTALTSAKIWVGTSGNVAAAVTISGDFTISNTGVGAIDAAVWMKTANYIVRETPSGTINGSNATFTLANTPVSGTEHVYLNGLLMDAGAGNDYTISSGTITMLQVPQTGDKLRVSYTK